jgi:hypothetical protein
VWSDASPTIAGAALLSSVSCVPDGRCVAVGYRGDGAGRRPLVERWQANHWSATPVQLPRHSRLHDGSELISVSCTTARVSRRLSTGIGRCAAVGEYGAQTRNTGLSVGWFVESLGPVLPLRTG